MEAEQWLGALLHANDELVTALMTFEQLDRSIDADSDSDDELAEQAHMFNKGTNFPRLHFLHAHILQQCHPTRAETPTSPRSSPVFKLTVKARAQNNDLHLLHALLMHLRQQLKETTIHPRKRMIRSQTAMRLIRQWSRRISHAGELMFCPYFASLRLMSRGI